MNVTFKQSVRKLTSSALALTMVCSMVPSVVFAAEPTTPTLELVAEVTAASGQSADLPASNGSDDGAIYNVEQGDTVTVTIYGVGNADYTNATWTLTYDNTQMTYADGADTGTIEGEINGDSGTNEYTTADKNTSGKTLELATYDFTVKALATGTASWFRLSTNTSYMNTYDQAIADDMVEVTGQDDYVNIELSKLTVDVTDPTLGSTLPAGSSFDPATNTLTVPYIGTDYSTCIEGVAYESGVVSDATVAIAPWTVVDADDTACTDVGTYTTTITATKLGYETVTCDAIIVVKALDTITAVTTCEKTTPSLTNNVTVTVGDFIDDTMTGTIEITAKDDEGNTVGTATVENTAVKTGQDASTHIVTVTVPVTASAAGLYDVTAKYIPGENDNYNGSEDAAGLIDQPFVGEFTIDTPDDVTVVYNGAKHTINPAAVEGWTAAVTYPNIDAADEDGMGQTNVGKQTVTVTYTHTDGYYEDVVFNNVKLEVTPKPIELTVTSQNLEFAKALPDTTDTAFYAYTAADGAIITGDKVEITYAVTPFNPGLNAESNIAGTTAEASTTNDNGNYDITIKDGKLTVVANNMDQNPGDDTAPDATNGSYLIEVVAGDYVKTESNGYRMIIVYTNEALYATYSADGVDYKMYDVTAATDGINAYTYVNDLGTAFSDSESFAHKYAVVVPAVASWNAGDYRANVTITDDISANGGEVTYGTNVNDSAKTDLNDLSTIYGVYKARDSYMSDPTKAMIILGSDLSGDKKVDTDDTVSVKEALGK